jgi:hypothetical protein
MATVSILVPDDCVINDEIDYYKFLHTFHLKVQKPESSKVNSEVRVELPDTVVGAVHGTFGLLRRL